MKYLLAACLFFFVLVLCIWNILVPLERIPDLVDRSLEGSSIKAEFDGLKKGFFYNFTAEKIRFKKNETTLLVVENISGRIELLRLLGLRLPVNVRGDFGGGSMTARVDLIGSDRGMALSVSNASTDLIPLFSLSGIKGRGLLSGELLLKNNAGDARFDISDAKFTSATFGGIPVPLGIFRSARAALSIDGRTVKVVSFSMEGEDIYARVKGDITGGRPDLSLELMPEKTFTEKNPAFMLLEKYRVSPGYYSVPLTIGPDF
ncbi:MAG: type II secretion system protein GspN [Nitrospirae bacterium]|nr:type II secretion system protein GspN [Nitrospirota bacterium]